MAVKTPAPQRAASRRVLAAKGQALPDGTAPIPDVAYLKKAIRSKGRVDRSKWPALGRLIRKRAKELKATNAPGVKGTWAFPSAKPAAKTMAGDNAPGAVDLASATAARRLPVIRGAADVMLRRSGPGTVTVQHRSTGMAVGTLKAVDNDGQWMATHAPTGAKIPRKPGMQDALAGLITRHNALARKRVPANQMGSAVMPGAGKPRTAGYAGEQEALDLAGALPYSAPAVSASDGPRVTTMGAGKKAAGKPARKIPMSAQGMSPEVAKIYAKLCKRGVKGPQALALAKRAAAMRARAQAKAA